MGLATVFVCMMLVCNSILQAHGFVNLPVLVMVLGGVLKIVTNYNLVVRPEVGIFGAPAGNILCFGLCLALDLLIISRVIPKRPRYLPIFVKPLAASALMGGAAWVVYRVLARLLSAVPEGGDGGCPQQDGQRCGHLGGYRSGYGGLSGAGGGPAGHLTGGPVPDAQGG